MFCGYLEVSSGRFTYSNGGHCPPLLQQDRQIRPIPMPKGLLLGVYPARKLPQPEPAAGGRKPADGLHRRGHRSGEPRRAALRDAGVPAPAERGRRGSLHALIGPLRQRLRGFTSSRRLEDDCTLLLLGAARSPASAWGADDLGGAAGRQGRQALASREQQRRCTGAEAAAGPGSRGDGPPPGAPASAAAGPRAAPGTAIPGRGTPGR